VPKQVAEAGAEHERSEAKIANSIFFGNTSNIGDPMEADDDLGFDEDAWFAMASGNSTDDPGYTAADCQNGAGPTAAVTGSGVGAFADSATWMEG
jgi:hypothetical protein